MSKSLSLLSLVCFAFVACAALAPTNANAQKNSKTAVKAKKADAKKDSRSAKNDKKADKKSDKITAKTRANDKKSSAKNAADKKSKALSKEDKRKQAAAEKSEKNRKDKEDSRVADKRTAKNDKRRQTAAEKAAVARAEAERRRQALIEAQARREREEAERRRRAEIERRRREAIARARAFENGLRTETQANILTDDTTGEDLNVRRAAISALGSRAGSVVVMDAQNGQIVTVVNQKWAMGKGYKPCSTIKLLTGIAGKNEKVINDFGNVSYKPQRLDLTDALAVSNNGYFQNVGGAVGFGKMMSHARELGLGQTTGINAAGESAGKIPDFKTGYAVNHMSSHGDDFEVTPLQLATMVSAITNGGKLLQPQIARTAKEADDLRPKVRRKLNFSEEVLKSVVPGMSGAVNFGTARRANDPSLNIGGKTGSCIGQGSWLGLFASVAPIVSPKYAVVVVTRGQAERGKWASQVAGGIYQALAPRIRALTPMIANSPNIVVPTRPKVDAAAAATLSDEETDDSAETTVTDAAATTSDFGAGAQTNQPALNQDKGQLVRPTVSSRPANQPLNPNVTISNQKQPESKPNSRVVIVPNANVPQITPTIKSRPRVVQP